MSNLFVPVDVKRQVVREMADWLEERSLLFTFTPKAGVNPVAAEQAKINWQEGYDRAIFELRAVAIEPDEIPDDISELDGGCG